jgi:hypothetical protein
MTQKTAGWTIALAGIGMMAGLIGADIIQLMHLGDTLTPSFIGNMLLHLSATIAAFVGGRLIPDDRTDKFTRSTDK